MANLSIRNTAPIRSTRAQDWALVVLAIWLFISPWVLNFGSAAAGNTGGAEIAAGSGIGHAAWNAWILGIILFLVAISAIGRMQASQEWITLVLGAWIFIAPWVLGFVLLQKASWDHWVVGVLVFLVALANLWMLRTAAPMGPVNAPSTPPRQPPLT